jgi:replicative DNA helicase
MNSLVARYNANKEQRLRGIPYPWDVLNTETRGMIPGEFILLYGRPKSMKTWCLLKIATHAYDYGSRRVLIYTREMSPEQMMDRCICLLIEAPYSAFKKGKLSEIPLPDGGTMEDRFHDVSSTLRIDEEACTLETGFRKSIIITSDREAGGVNGLKQKAIDHEVDLICVDAMYLMRNDRKRRKSIKWDDQSDITQDTKDVAIELNRPLVGTTQANRPSEDKRGYSMANIAFADAYGMNCDLAMEINKKTTRDPEVNELAMAITGAREINLNGFAIHGCPATNFEVLMRTVLNDKGVAQLDEAGNKMMEPVVFYENKDIRDFFKGADDEKDAHNSGRFRPQVSKGEMTKWAREHFSASKRQ